MPEWEYRTPHVRWKGGDDRATWRSGEYIPAGEAPAYEGEYTLTPTEDTQTLPTDGRLMAADVVIEPIPTNYGRIEYDGVGITLT